MVVAVGGCANAKTLRFKFKRVGYQMKMIIWVDLDSNTRMADSYQFVHVSKFNFYRIYNTFLPFCSFGKKF